MAVRGTRGFNIHTIGVILMLVGVIGIALSMLFRSSWGGCRGGYRREHRVMRDGTGGYVEEERRDLDPVSRSGVQGTPRRSTPARSVEARDRKQNSDLDRSSSMKGEYR